MSFKTFTESKVNKFNIHWQLIRTKAKQIKNVNDKIDFVLDFLNKNPNKHNYGRVMNWLIMTSYAYKDGDKFTFVNAIQDLKNNKDKYSSDKDMKNDLNKISKDELKQVYNDLSKRKYGFQYSTPPAHTEFLSKLKNFIDN